MAATLFLKKWLLFVSSFLCLSGCFAHKIVLSQEKKQISKLISIFNEIKKTEPYVSVDEHIKILTTDLDDLTEDNLFFICKDALKDLSSKTTTELSDCYMQLKAMYDEISTQLKDYKITGFGFSMHPSWAIGYGKQNFDVNLNFKNTDRKIFSQSFNIQYSTIGYQIEANVRFDVIFVLNSDISLFAAQFPIKFKTGFTIGLRLPVGLLFPGTHRGEATDNPLSVVGCTILPFNKKGKTGIMLIAHIGVGFTGLSSMYRYGQKKGHGDFNCKVGNSGGCLLINAAIIPAGGKFSPTDCQA
jgi:hypothetical protein